MRKSEHEVTRKAFRETNALGNRAAKKGPGEALEKDALERCETKLVRSTTTYWEKTWQVLVLRQNFVFLRKTHDRL